MLRPATKKASCTLTDAGDRDGDGLCLPDDVLLDILHCLPCPAIAQSRTICRAWRSLVDDHGLSPPPVLLIALLPRHIHQSYRVPRQVILPRCAGLALEGQRLPAPSLLP
ncbi:hypothetical protein ACQ4PT_003474 [Festuca glaucescens]